MGGLITASTTFRPSKEKSLLMRTGLFITRFVVPIYMYKLHRLRGKGCLFSLNFYHFKWIDSFQLIGQA